MTKRAKRTATNGSRSSGQADKEFGQRLRNLRIEREMSQQGLAETLGVSFQQVQKYEKGVNRIGAARLDVIARVLGVPVTYFFEVKGVKAMEAEGLINGDARYNLRLLRAYAALGNEMVQRQFVQLMERVAGIDNP